MSEETLQFAINLLISMQPKEVDIDYKLPSEMNLLDAIDYGEKKQQNREYLVYQRQIDELEEMKSSLCKKV